VAGEGLRVLSGPAAGQVLTIGGEFVIGRAQAGAGSLQGDSDISRRHARVHEYAPGMLAVEDLGSTNGTFVNGQRITAPHVLAPGDQVQVGKTLLRYESVPPSAPPPAAGPPAPPPGALVLGAGTPLPPPTPRPRPPGRGRLIALIGIPALLVAGVVIAIVASSGGGGEDGGGTSASASSPTAVVMTFFEDAARGDSAGACALLSAGADPRNTPASLLVAGTGTIVATTSQCRTTLDALYHANPDALRSALPKIRLRAANTTSARSDVIISRPPSGLTYKATVEKSGSGWGIAECVVG
jgi:hypothetical protein